MVNESVLLKQSMNFVRKNFLTEEAQLRSHIKNKCTSSNTFKKNPFLYIN